nr:ABC transporter substrate binding protein [Methylomonas sp. SURF-2]
MFCTAAAAASEILILQSHDSMPYQQTLAGFQAGLAHSRLEAVYRTLILSNEQDVLNPLSRQAEIKLTLALGTPATRAALAGVAGTPIVAGLVLDADELNRNPQVTGVGLNFSADLQWLWLRRLLPDARQIAVLYEPRQGSVLLRELQKLALVEGITLTRAPIGAAADLPAMMQNLPPQLDALWVVDGASAYSAAAVRELLLYSFRNRVPLIGLSAQWVKAGALYALDWDYWDLGAQLADLAADILLKGIPPAALPPRAPRKVRAVLNLKTAEHMKLRIAERWLPELSEVIP